MTDLIVASDGARIAFDLLGDSDALPIVLVHSLGCDHQMWDHQLGELARTHRVVALDLRGHGKSDAPDADYTLDRLSTDVLEVADGLGIESFDYCGLSVGGLIGLWLGLNARSRVRSLTLCNTGAKISETERWNERIELARTRGMRTARRRGHRPLVHTGLRRRPAPSRRAVPVPPARDRPEGLRRMLRGDP